MTTHHGATHAAQDHSAGNGRGLKTANCKLQIANSPSARGRRGQRGKSRRGAWVVATLWTVLLAVGCGPEFHLKSQVVPVRETPSLERAEPWDIVSVTWSKSLGPTATGHYRSVALADFNNDGLADIACGGFNPKGIQVWHGNGDGTWRPRLEATPLGNIHDLAIADFNNDGWLDILSSSEGDLIGVRLWVNDQKGGWGEAEAPSMTGIYNGVRAADFNKDGHFDVVAARLQEGIDGGVSVWLSDGKGSWTRDTGPTNTGIYRDVCVADFNLDGNLDIAATAWGTYGGVRVWYGNGEGGWRPGPRPADRYSFWGIDAADLNADGRPDLIIGTGSRGVWVFFQQSGGRWSAPLQLIEKGDFWSVKAVDFNHDGAPDIVAASHDERGIYLWLETSRQLVNDPQRRVVVERPFPRWRLEMTGLPHAGTFYGMAVGDANDDGRPDLFAAHWGGGVLGWLQLESGRLRLSPRSRKLEPQVPTRAPEEATAALKDPEQTIVYTTIREEGRAPFTEYRIGPRDKLKVKVFASPLSEEEEYLVRVGGDGMILLPQISQDRFYINGKTSSEVAAILLGHGEKRTGLRATYHNPVVEVEVTEYVSKKAMILGEVRIKITEAFTGPGLYPLTGKVRVLEFLSDHGGPTDKADLDKVEIQHQTGQKERVNLYKAIFEAKQRENPIVDEGDIIFIPSLKLSDRKIFVFGEVRTPGLVEIQRDVTVLEAIQRAGSFTERANTRQVIIARGNPTKPELFVVNADDILYRGRLEKNVILRDGDFVIVPRDFVARVKDFWELVRPPMDLIFNAFMIDKLTE